MAEMVKIKDAAKAYKALNGIICVYKPPCVTVRQVRQTIVTHLCRELNELPDRPLEQRVEIIGATNAPMHVKLVPNLADHPLVCGPRYLAEDFRSSCVSHLGLFSSGVLLLGINDGTKLTYQMHLARPTRAYKIHGQLGKATDTYFWNGRTMERTTFKHVTREKLDGIVAHMQAAHQKAMFEERPVFEWSDNYNLDNKWTDIRSKIVGPPLVRKVKINTKFHFLRQSGVHIESQTAYKLASRGVIRPANSKTPIIYGIKCVHFEPPNFTLEVQAVNEYDKYLWTVIHDLGVQLKSAAYCTGVQCIRQGKFDVELALLRKHWRLEYIMNNMEQCHRILEENEQLLLPQSAYMTV